MWARIDDTRNHVGSIYVNASFGACAGSFGPSTIDKWHTNLGFLIYGMRHRIWDRIWYETMEWEATNHFQVERCYQRGGTKHAEDDVIPRIRFHVTHCEFDVEFDNIPDE